MSKRLKLHYLARLFPFVEANYNFIELGPRGTGKSCAFSEFSPYSTPISGGQATTSTRPSSSWSTLLTSTCSTPFRIPSTWLCALLKLLHPTGEPVPAELDEYLEYAVEGRRRVKEQMNKRKSDDEYTRINLSFFDHTGTERVVSCEESKGSQATLAPKRKVIDELDAAAEIKEQHYKILYGSTMEEQSDSDEKAPDDLFLEHLRALRDIGENPASLGARPDDLARVLALIAVAGPGTCALCSLVRIAPGIEEYDSELLSAALRVSWRFRTLFNLPESIALLRVSDQDEDIYWRLVLQYCLEGNLQSLLDEQAHVLLDACWLNGHEPRKIVKDVSSALAESLSIRSAPISRRRCWHSSIPSSILRSSRDCW